MTSTNTITTLQQAKRDKYGSLKIDFEFTIKKAYPQISIEFRSPGCHSDAAEIYFRAGKKNCISVPGGQYSSNKHWHTAGHGILAIETARNNKLNLAKRPLFLLKCYQYNGDYRSLSEGFFLFGQNEDESFFLHKIRPKAARNFNLDEVRAWIWSLKPGEKVRARQGDLAFIPKTKSFGIEIESEISLGNHQVTGEVIRKTKNKIYVLNPKAIHYEHDGIANLQGWYELRLAKAWQASRAD